MGDLDTHNPEMGTYTSTWMGKKTTDHTKKCQHVIVSINAIMHAHKDNGQTDLKATFTVQSTEEKLFTITNKGLLESNLGTNSPKRK